MDKFRYVPHGGWDGGGYIQCGRSIDEDEDCEYIRLEDITNLIKDLIDTDDCQLDHHGYCQAHGWMKKSECPHSRAKKLINP